ncbi:triose-phosphate isomerase, partial [uncultured Fretibacterium sp.]|uniref:triose-phosphate isomerase n=1 Tax=uncultured Fretibacterium sp. TaxID=1678694 RepID=UPI00262FE91A
MKKIRLYGNWKMNMTPTEAKALATTLAPLVKNPEVDVVYCVPFIDIFPVKEVIAGTATAGIPHGAIIADKMNL